MTDQHLDATWRVLGEVLDERRNQTDRHGWTPGHDDARPVTDFAWLIARRAVEMCHPDAFHAVDARRLFVEIAAIATAALETYDRRTERTG
ncbi:MAG TPA: hypothetical protein VIQ02_09090 [Jiangellaceae bacterium]